MRTSVRIYQAVQAEIPVMLQFTIVAAIQIDVFTLRGLAAIYCMVAEFPDKSAAQSRILFDQLMVIFNISGSVSHSMAVFYKQKRRCRVMIKILSDIFK